MTIARAVAACVCLVAAACAGDQPRGVQTERDSAPGDGVSAAPAAFVRGAPSEAAPLLGFSAAKVRETLGPAGFVRRDGPAEIWRYASAECTLDLFLYRDQNETTVAHMEARPRGAQRVSAKSCYERLLAIRRASVAG